MTEVSLPSGSSLKQLAVRKINREVWVKKQHFSWLGFLSDILVTLAVPKYFSPSQIQEEIPGARFLCILLPCPKYLVYQQHSIDHKGFFLQNADMWVLFADATPGTQHPPTEQNNTNKVSVKKKGGGVQK